MAGRAAVLVLIFCPILLKTHWVCLKDDLNPQDNDPHTIARTDVSSIPSVLQSLRLLNCIANVGGWREVHKLIFCILGDI